MGLAEIVNKNPQVALIVAVVVLAVAVSLIFMRGGGRGATTTRQASFYYDITAGQTFTADAGQTTVVTPSAGPGALAHVFSCGDCSDASTHFVGYIEKYTEQALAAAQSGSADAEAALNEGHLVAEPNTDPQWFIADGAEGVVIQNAAIRKCPTAHECVPQ